MLWVYWWGGASLLCSLTGLMGSIDRPSSLGPSPVTGSRKAAEQRVMQSAAQDKGPGYH